MTPSHPEPSYLAAVGHRCSQDLCTIGPRETAHREVPDFLAPHNNGDPSTPTVTFSLERHETYDAAGNIEHVDVHATLGMGVELADVDLDELHALVEALAALESRGRRLREATAADPLRPGR